MTTPNRTEHDTDHLVASVLQTLRLLDEAERQPSFPGPGEEPDADDVDNEASKQTFLRRERERYKGILERLGGDESHGIPVAQEFLETALGLSPSIIGDDPSAEIYARRFMDEAEGGVPQ